MKNNLCFITNIAPHYREPIFSLIDKEIGCDFYIGDHIHTKLKVFDYHILSGYRKTLKNRFIGPFYWQQGSVQLVFKPYKYYILDGEPFCLSSWVILILCRLLGKKTIAWTHGWYGRESLLKGFIKKIFYKQFSTLMLYNRYAMRLMEEIGFDPNRMYCIANSMDSDKEKAIRATLQPSNVYSSHFNNNLPTIIYCGRIQKWKKLEMIIDSMKMLKDAGHPVNAVFIGKDVEEVHLERYAEQCGLQANVWMYGPCYDDAIIGQMFYDAAVCVSPGNVGLTAIHSLSFGCPVITHNNFSFQNPEFEAIAPGVTGDFFEQGSLYSLTQTIEKWTYHTSVQREDTRHAAFNEIDKKWNVHYQIKIIKEVLHAN